MATTEIAQQTDAEYHADFSRISNSMLSDFIESRRLFEGRYVTGNIATKEQTKPMEFGDIIHSVILDGRPLRSCVSIYPDYNPLVGEAKEMTGPKRAKLSESRKAAICKMLGMSIIDFEALKPGEEMKSAISDRLPLNPINPSGGLTKDAETFRAEKRLEGVQYCVKRHEYDLLRTVTNEARRSSAFVDFIDNPSCLKEHPLSWVNQFGQHCRCKVDFLLVGKDACYAFDVKVTAFHRPIAWKKHVKNTPRLQTQAAHYSDGISANFDGKPVEWRWLTISPTEPVTPGSVMIHRLDARQLDRISEKYFDLMASVLSCYESSDFRDIGEDEENLVDEFPDWSLNWEG